MAVSVMCHRLLSSPRMDVMMLSLNSCNRQVLFGLRLKCYFIGIRPTTGWQIKEVEHAINASCRLNNGRVVETISLNHWSEGWSYHCSDLG